MLQNRVDPYGNIIKTDARGAWLGNRGLIHNDRQQIVRPFRLKAWITCLLDFKGRRRKVMSPRLYTELFFLDEATAFAAGHRPCAECRREDFNRFKAAWLKGNPEYGFNEKVVIGAIDEIIHNERVGADGEKRAFKTIAGDLPDGCFIVLDGKAHLLDKGKAYAWSPYGYEEGVPAPEGKQVEVLTPESIVNCFRGGYQPQNSIKS
jgi:hypothetical protein